MSGAKIVHSELFFTPLMVFLLFLSMCNNPNNQEVIDRIDKLECNMDKSKCPKPVVIKPEKEK